MRIYYLEISYKDIKRFNTSFDLIDSIIANAYKHVLSKLSESLTYKIFIII